MKKECQKKLQQRKTQFELNYTAHKRNSDVYKGVDLTFLFFSLGHFSLLFATCWSNNMCFAEFWREHLPLALFIDVSIVI